MNAKLVEVFLDTQEKVKILNTKTITTKHNSSDILYPDFDEHTKNVKVINSDSVSALVEYAKKGKTTVLNMASFKKPGGGVRNGARAQEECLFRCSNLATISADFYPLGIDEALYTKDSIFVKDFNYNDIDSVTCDTVTVPAINLNNQARYDDLQDDLDYESITKNKMRLMLSLCITNHVSNVILGSWGCGVFKNEPQIIAKYFKDVIEEGYNEFDNIIFAIINDHNSVDNNFKVFKDVLCP